MGGLVEAGNDRTPGRLRRHPARRRATPVHVAMLAGVSPAYYTRLERGNLSGVSPPSNDNTA
jgi:hypothetical protein